MPDQHPGRNPGIGQLGGPGRAQAALNRWCSLRAVRIPRAGPHQSDHPVGRRTERRCGCPPPQHHGTLLVARGQIRRRREWQRGQCRQRLLVVSHGREHRGQRILLINWRKRHRRGNPAADDVLVGGELGKHLVGRAAVRTRHIGRLGDEPVGPGGGGVVAPRLAVLDQGPPPGVRGGQRRLHPHAEIIGGAGRRPADRAQHRTRPGQQLGGMPGMAVCQLAADRGQGLAGIPGLAQALPAEPARCRGSLGRVGARRTRDVELGIAVSADARSVNRLRTAAA